jgi:hypothetical protein
VRAEFIHQSNYVTRQEAKRFDSPVADVSTHRPFSFLSSRLRAVGFVGFTPSPALQRQQSGEQHIHLKETGHKLLLDSVSAFLTRMHAGKPSLPDYIEGTLFSVRTERSQPLHTGTDVYGQIEAGMVVFESSRTTRIVTIGNVSVQPLCARTQPVRTDKWSEYMSPTSRGSSPMVRSTAILRSQIPPSVLLCSDGVDGHWSDEGLTALCMTPEFPTYKDGIAMLIST